MVNCEVKAIFTLYAIISQIAFAPPPKPYQTGQCSHTKL